MNSTDNSTAPASGATTTSEQDAAQAFRIACDAEEPLQAAENICRAIALVAETLGDEYAGPVQRLAWLALGEIEQVQALREKAFHVTHKWREFERREVRS